LAALSFVSTLQADPIAGRIYSFNMVDVDQHTLATADGHVTILVFTSSADVERARKVGDRVPDYCLANPEFRMVTILRFEKNHHAPMRAIVNALVRRRLDSEAERLNQRYRAKNITRNARSDVFAVTDFDGAVGSHVDLAPRSTQFRVIVLGRKGELLGNWSDVPTADELAAVVR
jgi:hypothetical protein